MKCPLCKSLNHTKQIAGIGFLTNIWAYTCILCGHYWIEKVYYVKLKSRRINHENTNEN